MLRTVVIIQLMDFIPKYLMFWRILLSHLVTCNVKLSNEASLTLLRFRSYHFGFRRAFSCLFPYLEETLSEFSILEDEECKDCN